MNAEHSRAKKEPKISVRFRSAREMARSERFEHPPLRFEVWRCVIAYPAKTNRSPFSRTASPPLNSGYYKIGIGDSGLKSLNRGSRQRCLLLKRLLMSR
jgi:hypothetical protein